MTAGYGASDFVPGGGPIAGNALFDGLRRLAPADLIASNHKHADEYLKVSSNPSEGKGGTCFGDFGSPLNYDDAGTWVMLANTFYGTNGVCAGVGYYNRARPRTWCTRQLTRLFGHAADPLSQFDDDALVSP